MDFKYVAWKPNEETKKLKEKADSYDTPYSESDNVVGLLGEYNKYKTENNPGTWTGGAYGQAKTDTYNEWNNRKPFSYDLNGDALYQQYKDKYINQGRLAMADTMGQASAMTGGYGSSYAVTAGNQAYQSHLQNLNDIVPQLYQMAYERYNQEGEDLKTKYSMLSDLYNTEYGEFRDNVSDYNTNLDRLYNIYTDARNFEYGSWNDDRNYYQTAYQNAYNRDYGAHQDTQNRLYQANRDAVQDYQWSKMYDLQKAAAEAKEIYGLSNDEVQALLALRDNEDWEGIDKYIGSLKLDEETRRGIQDLWLPENWGRLPNDIDRDNQDWSRSYGSGGRYSKN